MTGSVAEAMTAGESKGPSADSRDPRNTMKAIFCSILASMACLSSTCSGSENIRVIIADNLAIVKLEAPRALVLQDGTGRDRGRTAVYRAEDMGRGRMRIASRGGPVTVNGKAYRGLIELRGKTNGRLQVVNVLDVEEYLLGVVAAEIPSTWEMEALKAQAVAARSYALYQKQNAGRRPYDVRSTVDGQMYLGKRGERKRAAQAVEATRGIVLAYDGVVIPAFFHSSCGGHTEDALALWGIDAPYLKGVDCDCQTISTYGVWERRFSAALVAKALGREGFRMKRIEAIAIGSMTPGGRVKDVLLRHAGGSTAVPAEALRSSLGYSKVPSIFFEPEFLDGEVVLSGRGMGHGVGLCQWGAKEMAGKGRTYAEILRHYYPGTALVRAQDLPR